MSPRVPAVLTRRAAVRPMPALRLAVLLGARVSSAPEARRKPEEARRPPLGQPRQEAERPVRLGAFREAAAPEEQAPARRVGLEAFRQAARTLAARPQAARPPVERPVAVAAAA